MLMLIAVRVLADNDHIIPTGADFPNLSKGKVTQAASDAPSRGSIKLKLATCAFKPNVIAF